MQGCELSSHPILPTKSRPLFKTPTVLAPEQPEQTLGPQLVFFWVERNVLGVGGCDLGDRDSGAPGTKASHTYLWTLAFTSLVNTGSTWKDTGNAFPALETGRLSGCTGKARKAGTEACPAPGTRATGLSGRVLGTTHLQPALPTGS